MPIIEVKGDLVESDCNIIAHGCNCFNTMGSGVAAAIRKRFPEAYETDCETKRGDRTKLGKMSVASVVQIPGVRKPTTIHHVVNLYTQYNFGNEVRQLDYEALANCLVALRSLVDRFPTAKVGIPRIGCGLAGGDWNIVKAFIEATFHDKDIYVYYL